MNYYQINFALMQHHNYSLTEIDEMIPWERDIYLTLLKKHIEKTNEETRAQNEKMRRGQ